MKKGICAECNLSLAHPEATGYHPFCVSETNSTAAEFLKSKIGFYNPHHPFLESEIDYEDIEKWLDEYKSQGEEVSKTNTMKSARQYLAAAPDGLDGILEAMELYARDYHANQN